jgi:hypothetical protein
MSEHEHETQRESVREETHSVERPTEPTTGDDDRESDVDTDDDTADTDTDDDGADE